MGGTPLACRSVGRRPSPPSEGQPDLRHGAVRRISSDNKRRSENSTGRGGRLAAGVPPSVTRPVTVRKHVHVREQQTRVRHHVPCGPEPPPALRGGSSGGRPPARLGRTLCGPGGRQVSRAALSRSLGFPVSASVIPCDRNFRVQASVGYPQMSGVTPVLSHSTPAATFQHEADYPPRTASPVFAGARSLVLRGTNSSPPAARRGRRARCGQGDGSRRGLFTSKRSRQCSTPRLFLPVP